MAKKGVFAIMKSITYLELLRLIINDPETLTQARLREGSFTRNRLMPFSSALHFILDMRKTTLQTRLNIYFEHSGGIEPMSQQEFSKLRMNFDHSPFETMHKTAVKVEYSNESELPLWHGYHVFGIDGSFLQLPRTDEIGLS